MAERLKDLYFTGDFVQRLAAAIVGVQPTFDRARFLGLVLDATWPGLELKQKMHHISLALGATLPRDYAQALGILCAVAPSFRGFDATVFPDFVATFGLDDFDLSMQALAFFTPLCTSEYGVRPFIDRDPERAMAYLQQWAGDPNEHVRRLASEGCRPRVPWGMVLQGFRRDPRPILPVLERLKDDASEYVRNSVANNLNDISKDHPELVLDICERWCGDDEARQDIIKRALRSLLKQGNRRAMRLFGFGEPEHIRVQELFLGSDTVAIGGELCYDIELRVESPAPARVRLELRVDYLRANGRRSRKVFQIGEGTYPPGQHRLSRKLSFADRSTRKHHPGEHRLTVVVNGVEKAEAVVNLRAAATNEGSRE